MDIRINNINLINNTSFGKKVKPKKVSYPLNKTVLTVDTLTISKPKQKNNHLANIEEIKRKYLTPDENGEIRAFNLDTEGLMQLNCQIKDYPELVEKLYTAQDRKGHKLLHYPPSDENNSGVETLMDMHNTIKQSNPDLLKRVHLIKCNAGFIPAHRYAQRKIGLLKELHREFAGDTDILYRIHRTKNNSGAIPIMLASTDALREIHRVFKNEPVRLRALHNETDNYGLTALERFSSLDNYSEYGAIIALSVPDLPVYEKKTKGILASIFSRTDNIGM